MLSGLIERVQAADEVSGDGSKSTSTRNHFGWQQHPTRASRGSRQFIDGHGIRRENVWGVDRMRNESMNMTHESHWRDGYHVGGRHDGDLFAEERAVMYGNTYQNADGKLSHGNSSSLNRNQRGTKQNSPLYRRTSQNTGPTYRRRYQPRGQQGRRYEPYLKQRPAYPARKPILSIVSPSYSSSFDNRAPNEETYVPSNPTILPMVGDDKVLWYPTHKLQAYRSPTSPPGYTPVSPAYQSFKPCMIDAMTRANLKRKLAVTILGEKLKHTLAKENETCKTEYNPSAHSYCENKTKQTRIEYDPARPQYS